PGPVVVAEGVDVRRRVVRGDDHLGVEGRPALRRIGVDDVPHYLRRREERVELRLAGERLRQVDHLHRCSFPAISRQTWTIRGMRTETMRSPVSALARVASPTTPDSVMSRSMSIGTT